MTWYAHYTLTMAQHSLSHTPPFIRLVGNGAIEQYHCHHISLIYRSRFARVVHYTLTEKREKIVMNFIASIEHISLVHAFFLPRALSHSPVSIEYNLRTKYHLNNLSILHVWKSIEFLFAPIYLLCASVRLWCVWAHRQGNGIHN